MPFGINVLCAGMESRIFGQYQGSVVVGKQKSRLVLWQAYSGCEHAEPFTFACCFGNGYVFRVAGRLGHGFLFASSPGDSTGITKEKAVSSNGPASVGTTGIARIRKASEVGRVFATESQLEFASGFEIAEDVFAGIPVSAIVEGQELAEFANREGDVWARGDSEIHEES